MSKILDIPAHEIQPFDVVSEGETVRTVTYGRRSASLEEHILYGVDEVDVVTVEVACLRMVEEPIDDLPGSPVFKRPEWEDPHCLFFKPDGIVRVARR